ncbi:MAG TPA: hypothetical protein VF572_06935 [Candidatus Saccharimonadales bacterium]|jgi:hypothetical protein
MIATIALIVLTLTCMGLGVFLEAIPLLIAVMPFTLAFMSATAEITQGYHQLRKLTRFFLVAGGMCVVYFLFTWIVS